jgi:hypothetical protein
MRDRAPVFVVGSARSGNTLLHRLLLSSENFPKYHAEPVVFDLLAPQFGPFKHRRNRERMMKYWLRSTQFRLSGLDAQQISARVVSEVESAGELLSTVMEEVARKQGCRRWAIWGPDNLLHMRAIKREIPNALFIHVIRDGRDVAHALHTKGFIRPFPWDRRHRLLVSALHWKWKVRKGRRIAPELGQDYLEVRFEDLVMNPKETLERIGDFIGVRLDYELIRNSQGAAVAPNTSFPAELESGSFAPVGRWRKHLSIEQVHQLEWLIGDELLALGYSLASQTTAQPGLRLRYLREVYPAFYSFKEWARLNTPLGRLVNMDRLMLQN